MGSSQSETPPNQRDEAQRSEDAPNHPANWNLFGKVSRRRRGFPGERRDVAELEANDASQTGQRPSDAAANLAHRFWLPSEDPSSAQARSKPNRGFDSGGLQARSSERKTGSERSAHRGLSPNESEIPPQDFNSGFFGQGSQRATSNLPIRPVPSLAASHRDSTAYRRVLAYIEASTPSTAELDRPRDGIPHPSLAPQFRSAPSARERRALDSHTDAVSLRTGLSQNMAHLAFSGSSQTEIDSADTMSGPADNSDDGLLGTLAAAAVAIESEAFPSTFGSQGADAPRMLSSMSSGLESSPQIRPRIKGTEQKPKRSPRKRRQPHAVSAKEKALSRLAAGETCPTIATDMGIPLSTLYDWRRSSELNYAVGSEEFTSSSGSESAEAQQTRGRNASEWKPGAREIRPRIKGAHHKLKHSPKFKRQFYDAHVKNEALSRIAAGEIGPKISSEMGIPLSTLYGWRRNSAEDATRQARTKIVAEKKADHRTKSEWVELKREALQMMAEGVRQVDVASHTGITRNTLYKWSLAASDHYEDERG